MSTPIKILILWASRTGQTESLAQRLFEVLQENQWTCELMPVAKMDWNKLSQYKVLLFGSPTYGNGDLHPDWDKPERFLRNLDLGQYWGGVFGCGSSRYSTPHWAVDILENRLKNGGVKLLKPSLKIDTITQFRVRDADYWAHSFSDALADLLPKINPL